MNVGKFSVVATVQNGKKVKGHDRKRLYTDRAKEALGVWLGEMG
jgi:hypothetical protein